MTRRRMSTVSMAAALLALILSACIPFGPGNPTQPAATAAPSEQQPIQPTQSAGGPQATPTRAGLLSAATVLIDETTDTTAAQGGKIQMNFNAPAMQPVTISTTLASGTPTYQLEVVDMYGNFLATYQSNPAQVTETIPELSLPFNGAYKLILDSVTGDGSLSVKVSTLGQATGGGSVDLGSSTDGLIGAPRTYHAYQFTLSQGQSVTMGATAEPDSDLDTSLIVYGPDGHYLTDADDVSAPTNLNAQVNGFVAPLDGLYTAVVTGKGQGTGSYTFSVAADTSLPSAQGAADIVYDKEYRANFTDKSNLDVTFDGSLGDVVKIDVSKLDSGVAIDAYLISPFGQPLAFAVNTGKGRTTDVNEMQLPYNGRYKLELRPIGDGQASFQVLHLTQPPTGGGILSDQQTKLPGTISQPNVFHVYQFDAVAGEKISLAAFSVSKNGALDLGFALISPSGHQLLFADDSLSQFPKDPELTDYEIMQTGTYLVIIYSYTPATGTYDFVFTRR